MIGFRIALKKNYGTLETKNMIDSTTREFTSHIYSARHIFFVPTVSLPFPYSYFYNSHLRAFLYYLPACTFLELRLYLATGVRKNK